MKYPPSVARGTHSLYGLLHECLYILIVFSGGIILILVVGLFAFKGFFRGFLQILILIFFLFGECSKGRFKKIVKFSTNRLTPSPLMEKNEK